MVQIQKYNATGDSLASSQDCHHQNPEDFLPASEMRHAFHKGNKSKVELHLGHWNKAADPQEITP